MADEQAELFTNAAVALAAISEDPEALQASISGAVPTLETGIERLPPQRPFLRDATTLTGRSDRGCGRFGSRFPI